MSRTGESPVLLGSTEKVAIADYDGVFVRKDPPFDDEYLWLSLILERARGETLMINDPRGLRDANEKLYACHFPELTPATLVSASRDAIRAFTKEQGGKSVIKPVDGHGGAGIFLLQSDDKNFNACVEAVTHSGKRVAMVQEFLPGRLGHPNGQFSTIDYYEPDLEPSPDLKFLTKSYLRTPRWRIRA